jgi:hypothetical protein
MDKKLNCKDELIDAEKRKQAIILLESWLQNLNLQIKVTKDK